MAIQPPFLHSAGGAETVTGSCHYVDLGDTRLLVDCGAFQGGRTLEARNREPFPFDPMQLDAMLLTHAHLDHVGRTPHLIASGFDGPIYCAPGSDAIAEVILRDAAKIAWEDYERALRRARRAGREADVEPPPFDERDVEQVLAALRPVPYDEPFTVGNVTVTLHPAGHVVGSAWIDLDTPAGRIVFSGDLGNRESLLHPTPDRPGPARAVVCEGTYGNRTHRSREATIAEFRDVLARAAESGGRVLIPSFALERTQAVLYEIHHLQLDGEIPGIPVFLDSPMASKMTAVYRQHAHAFRDEVRELNGNGGDPFTPPHFHATVSADESRALNDLDEPAIIIAGSGMMTGGRILHHLKHHMWKPDTQLVVVGYQARGSLGRAIVDGAKHVRIYGDDIAIRGTVHTIGGLSAHADRDDLDHWLAETEDARVYLVHGEVDVLDTYAQHLKQAGRNAHVVPDGRPITL